MDVISHDIQVGKTYIKSYTKDNRTDLMICGGEASRTFMMMNKQELEKFIDFLNKVKDLT